MQKFLLLSLMMLAAIPAEAQSGKALDQKILAMEKQIKALQRRVFKGEGAIGQNADPSADPSASPSGSVGERRLLADMSVKIGSLESQLRGLTGQLEEIQYRQREQQKVLDMLQRELAVRGGPPLANQQSPAQTQTNPPVSRPGEDMLSEPGAEAAAPTQTPPAPAVQLPEGTIEARYDYAFNFIRNNDLDSARIAFEQFIAAHQGDMRIGHAKYWLGRVHMLQKRPGLAANELLALVTEYQDHPKRPDALVDLATVLIDMDAPGEACNTLAEFNRVSDKASARVKQRASRLEKQANCS